MMKKIILLTWSIGFLLPLIANAEEPLIKVAVGEARVKKSVIAFPAIRTNVDPQGSIRQIRDICIEDLAFSGLFDFLDPAGFIENASQAGVTPGSFKTSDWTTIGAEFVLKGQGVATPKGVDVEMYLYQAGSGRQVFAKKYKANFEAIRKLGHTLANDVMFALTGKKGPFTSKIVFVSDRTGKKELYVTDYDGFNPIKLTSNHSLTMSPAWSPDAKRIIFSSVTKNKKNVRNHNLFTYELATGKIDLVSNKQGINSGAVYAPDGKKIALTMSFSGNPEIFQLDPATKLAQKITNNYGLDVDPSWSPDGRYLAFVSDRAGRPMIYKMNADGSNVTRLTFAGQYNATPSWSPAGNKIVFSGWDDGKFDLFLMNTDGSGLERLTKNMGNNEDPDFAPDGYFIIYSSNRMGKKNLYITNVDNTVHRRITTNFGNCESPRWGPAN
jgi:TolB protein